jgi:hypothetical protein
MDSETRPSRGPITHLDASGVCQDDRPTDSESKPMALRRASLLANKGFENSLTILDRHTRSTVLDRQHQLSVAGGFSTYGDRRTGRRVLDRVFNKVRDHALHRIHIDPDGGKRRRHVDNDLPTGALHDGPNAVQATLDDTFGPGH